MTGMESRIRTPREIVEELDRYVIGQQAAKRAVAIALRNRYRRRRVAEEMREEILPNNILMIGPTGVGKTEIARRLARLADAPFLKVEASKFTEVGYVGRDVESMVRDLVEIGVGMARARHSADVRSRASSAVEQKLLSLLLPRRRPRAPAEGSAEDAAEARRARERLRGQLASGELDGREVEIETASRASRPLASIPGGGFDEIDMGLAEAFESIIPRKRRKRRLTVGDARESLLQEETERLIDMDQVVAEGLDMAQQHGIIFIDEIDKIAGTHAGSGPEVSRQGVQRDLLPILEGSSVTTRYGMVRTDHVLFIAAGAFHENKPSELIPELQGRLPIRVELSPLSEEDFVRILTEPRNALVKQYQALLKTEGVEIDFEPGAIARIAGIAREVNEAMENIGARRLHTVLTTLLEDLLFEAPDGVAARVTISEERVEERLRPILGNKDLSRFIL